MTAPIRKKLIEVSIPLEAINAASRKQKAPKGYPTSLHTYWAPRPLAACRAVLFAQLVDDPSSWPDRFPTEEMQDAERRRLHKVIERFVPWEASNDVAILNETRFEIARSIAWGLGEEPPEANNEDAILDYLGSKAPAIYDPFSGGGSIPLEAQRLGLRAYGSDLNPVAVLLGKALVEIPPKFAGYAPVNPIAHSEAENGPIRGWKGAQGLAEDVRYYGKWMCEEADKKLRRFYPKVNLEDGSRATVIAWLWARTVRSPDPAAGGAMVPLISSYMLSTKEGKKTWVEPVVDGQAQDGYRFIVRTGSLSKTEEDRLKKGTIGRSDGGTCILTGSAMPFSYIRNEGKTSGLGIRLMAVVAASYRKRIYLAPDQEQFDIAMSAEPGWEPEGVLPDNPRDFKTPNYGMKTFASLFTRRQLLALTTMTDLIAEARTKAIFDAKICEISQDTKRLHEGGSGAHAYGDALATYLAFIVDRAANYGSSLSTWLTDDNAIRGTFGRQALPMTWDFCEGNYFGDSSAAFTTIIKTTSDVISLLYSKTFGSVEQADASKSNYPVSSCIINTDPPYYDNIGYADLSDFFYVWLKKSLGPIWPDLFRRLSTPKTEELVATPYRHGGKAQAEAFFINGMSAALTAMRKAARDGEPLAVYYAFKQAEVDIDGITSAGWASFLQAVVDAGLTIDGTWPLRTESGGRLIGRRANALASSIVLVCRKRNETIKTVTRSEFIRSLKREMPEAIDKIRKAGVGPVDMMQSIIGPGMGVFTRYDKVLEDDDSTMGVRTALALINRVWGEIENDLDANFDAETQVALAWFAAYGFEIRASGDLITLANAKNIPTNELFKSGVFEDMHGRTRITPREALPKDWSPATDKSLTVWECVQHSARVLNADDGGAEAAAKLVSAMGAKAESARALDYRLFQISTDKSWAAEALVYNELAQEWSHIEDAAASFGDKRGQFLPSLDLFGEPAR
jgi:putative DNA methylase